VRSIQQAVLDVGGQKPTDAAASYVIGMALMPALAHAAPDVPKTGCLFYCSNKGALLLCDPVTGQRTMDAEQGSSGGS